jgi:hypothetical protein
MHKISYKQLKFLSQGKRKWLELCTAESGGLLQPSESKQLKLDALQVIINASNKHRRKQPIFPYLESKMQHGNMDGTA